MTEPVRVLASEVDQQKAAPLGLFVLILLGVACYFLFKSMSRHLRRVRDDFPAAGFAPTGGTVSGEGSSSLDGPRSTIVGNGDGLTRPAPVTLTRGRASEPRLIGSRPVESRAIEQQPTVIEPETGSTNGPPPES